MKHTPDNWDDKTSLMEAYAKFDKAVKVASYNLIVLVVLIVFDRVRTKQSVWRITYSRLLTSKTA